MTDNTVIADLLRQQVEVHRIRPLKDLNRKGPS